MTTYEFTIFLADEMDESAADDLLGKCPDVIGSGRRAGVERVTFMREGADLESAIRSALTDLTALGHRPTRAELETSSLAAN